MTDMLQGMMTVFDRHNTQREADAQARQQEQSILQRIADHVLTAQSSQHAVEGESTVATGGHLLPKRIWNALTVAEQQDIRDIGRRERFRLTHCGHRDS